MTDSDRYMLVFSLILFFGLMALGLVVVHGSSKTEAAMSQLSNRLEAVAKAENRTKMDDLNCYEGAKLEAFLNEKTANDNFMQFLSAKASNDSNVSVYLDATPGGIGSYFILKTNTGKSGEQTGCVLAEGEGMKVAIQTPETDEITEAVTEAVEEAVEETSEAPVEETIEAVKEAVEETSEAIEETVEETMDGEESPTQQEMEATPQ